MSLSTDLSVSPYFDDFSDAKDFAKILFKPGFPIQVRELNQLQTILQRQIERFGDNILKTGTIVNGCNFTYFPIYPYVKVLDSTLGGAPALVDNYIGSFAKNSQNLVSYILAANGGFESQDPDLNTIYVRYLNSGSTKNLTSYSPSDILTIYDANNSIYSVSINSGGVAFSNSDSVVFLPAMVVNVSSSNTFANGELITQATTGAEAIIIEVNTTAIANSLVLKIEPVQTDLSNPAINSLAWTFNTGFNITSNTTHSVANVVQIIGSAASAKVITDGVGVVIDIPMVTQGSGYSLVPWTGIKSSVGSLNTVQLTSLNFQAQITVANTANALGTGYAFQVSNGVIYQKGYFLNADQQTVIISKYSNTPNAIVVGFDTTELLVNSNSDSTLLDNAIGTFNDLAPGADRLKLVPTLVTLSRADANANDHFFVLSDFSAGQPFKQNQLTSYNLIGDEMATRTYDTSGNFAIDQFKISTKFDAAANNSYFRVIIDPGYAYVNGRRVRTETNFSMRVRKGIDTLISPTIGGNSTGGNTSTGNNTTGNALTHANFGNYLVLNNIGGHFDSASGDLVSLRDTAGNFLSSFTAGVAPTGPGNEIGTARMRSIVRAADNSGTPGGPDCTYRLYLFDIHMNQGKDFRKVASVFYNGASFTAIGDVVTVHDATTNTAIATLANTDASTLIFGFSNSRIATINNVSYIYRNHNRTLTTNTSGLLAVNLVDVHETHPYDAGSTLTSAQFIDIIVIPLANAQASTNLAGNASVNTTSTTLLDSAADFHNTLFHNDYIKITDGANVDVRRVVSIINSTALTMDTNSTIVSSVANVVLFFPMRVGIPLKRIGRTANVDASKKLLTINLGTALAANISTAVVHNVLTSNVAPGVKTSHRNSGILINLANATGNTIGPWCIGHPDVYRLKHVYLDANLTAISTSSRDVTNEFYIDMNQNADFADASFLMKKPTSSLALVNTQVMLVVFDHYTTSNTGMFNRASYSVNDAITTLAALEVTTSVNSHEVPDFETRGDYYDLLDSVDFRMRVANTVAITNTANVAAIPINPPEPVISTKFGNTANLSIVQNFPVPDSSLTATLSNYAARVDRIIISDSGDIRSIEGTPSLGTPKPPPQPANTMTINFLYVPAYPTFPFNKSADVAVILDKKVANEKYSVQRLTDGLVAIPALKDIEVPVYQPTRYKMEDIARLERRIVQLEKQMALTVLEETIKEKILPSTVDPTLNRFKYGFFADDFSTYALTDTRNPEYNACITNNALTPNNFIINLPCKFSDGSNTFTFPATQNSVITQNTATFVPNNVINNITTATTVNVFSDGIGGLGPIQFQSQLYKMSNTAGAVKLYYNTFGADVTTKQGGVNVFQSVTADPVSGFAAPASPNFSAAADGRAMTAAEAASFVQQGGTPVGVGGIAGATLSKQSYGVVEFTHNPLNGLFYELGINVNFWELLFVYPADSKPVVNFFGTPGMNYHGTVVIQNPTVIPMFSYTSPTQQANQDYYPFPDSTTGLLYITLNEDVTMFVRGLRPQTIHKLYDGDVDVTAQCRRIGDDSFGDPLISTINGQLDLEYWWQSGVQGSTGPANPSTFLTNEALAARMIGTKTLTLKNSDGTSIATTTLQIVPGDEPLNITYLNSTVDSTGNTITSTTTTTVSTKKVF
jgi:hypothetical protein